jgi:hypothetical protein
MEHLAVTLIAHRSTLSAFVILAAVALVGCQSADDEPTPSASEAASTVPSASASVSATATTEPSAEESASPSAEADPGEEVSVFDIEAGDCFTADGDEIQSVLVVDCEQPHVYEAYHLFDHDAGADEAYPGDDAITDFADTGCRPPFEEFVDHDYDTSIWYISWLTPSADTWAEGDREIVCAVNQQDESEEPIEVTGSAEGAAE